MKRVLTALACAAAAVALPAISADVGVSISIGQPGVFGQIGLGNAARPPVIYSLPVMIERGRGDVAREPMYLRVPPGHAQHWSKHCSSYNACGRQVYFIRDDWYSNVYAPRYRDEHPDERGDYCEHREYGDASDHHENGHGGR